MCTTAWHLSCMGTRQKWLRVLCHFPCTDAAGRLGVPTVVTPLLVIQIEKMRSSWNSFPIILRFLSYSLKNGTETVPCLTPSRSQGSTVYSCVGGRNCQLHLFNFHLVRHHHVRDQCSIFGTVHAPRTTSFFWSCMLLLSRPFLCALDRGAGAGPAGTAAAGPMLGAKLMNLIKGWLQKF